MNQKSGTYQYKKITTTTTTRTVSNNPINKANAGESQKGKIDMNILKNENVEFYKCNKCGKFKYRIGAKKITHETGSFTRKTELTEIEKRSLEKYAKYNMASKTACPVCGNPRTKCVCKKNRSTSVSTVLNKRSAQGGPVDLTPKFKIDLNPEKIRKALEEQKRLAEEQRRKKESKTHKVEENVRRVIKEEKYTYDKKKERNIKEEDLCHCGDENCEVNIEIRKKKEMEEMMKKRREEGCIVVEMELAACQAVANHFKLELYDFLQPGDVLIPGDYDKSLLHSANHDLFKLDIGLKIIEEI